MTKQTVTGVAEGHLLHKDFLVEYDPDERTWTVEREVPAEPTPEPGTAGTATITLKMPPLVEHDVPGTWVKERGTRGLAFVTHRPVDGSNMFRAEVVTDFVPGMDRAAVTVEMERLEIALGKANTVAARMKELADSQTDIATKALDDRDAAEERARLAEREARAEHAEVERLRGRLEDIGQTQLATTLMPLHDAPDIENVPVSQSTHALMEAVVEMYGELRQIRASLEDAGMIRKAEPRGVSTPAVTTPGTETPAETPAPAAFVLPERSEVFELLETAYRDEVGPVSGYSPFLVRATTDVRALLAEHAVTEERLTDALRERVGDTAAARKKATIILARLTGKAEG